MTITIEQCIFKAYDIRGIVGQNLTKQVVNLIGQAIGSEAKEQGQNRLVVGRDGRHSSPELSQALIDGIIATGCNVIDIGQVPTPLVYFACEHLETYSGVMVTGSHNPAEYNGLKIVLAGKTLAGDDLQQLYQRIKQGNLLAGKGVCRELTIDDDYIDRVTGDIAIARSIKVVVDCGNGVAGIVAPDLLRKLGCDVIELYSEVDGSFPNHHPDPGQPENVQDLILAVQQHDAELGLAFDGDADRLGVVDGNGTIIWPDRWMILFAEALLVNKPGATILYDVKSTNLLAQAITHAGGVGVMCQSGHSLIKNKMRQLDAELAGEMSGHIFFKDRWYGFDDGIYVASRLLELITNDKFERKATEIFATIPSRESTPEIFVKMDDVASRKFIIQLCTQAQFLDGKITTIDGLRVDYRNGWGLVRASNTVPGLTLRFEADSAQELRQIQQQFKQKMLLVEPTLTLPF